METHFKRNDMPTRAQRFDVEVPADIWIPNQDEYITPPSRKMFNFGGFLSSPRKGTKYSLKAFIEKVVNAMGGSSEATTASNGLTEVGNDVQLGGTLTADTTITGPYSFTVSAPTGSSKAITLSATNTGGTVDINARNGITITTTNTAGDVVITGAGDASLRASSGDTFVTAASQATLAGNTAIVGTTATTGGNVSLLSNDGVVITANGVLGSSQDVTITSVLGGIDLTAATNITVALAAIPTYADDAAAGTGGLTAGKLYKTATGTLQIKL